MASRQLWLLAGSTFAAYAAKVADLRGNVQSIPSHVITAAPEPLQYLPVTFGKKAGEASAHRFQRGRALREMEGTNRTKRRCLLSGRPLRRPASGLKAVECSRPKRRRNEPQISLRADFQGRMRAEQENLARLVGKVADAVTV
jgi:hypothetical protein